MGKHRVDGFFSEYGHVASSCVCGNEPSDFIKYGEFVD
jgi:hypothetical protein